MKEKILIVDDESDILDICRNILEPAGYTVHTVSSGEKALEFLKQKCFVDIAVVDIRMPGMDGIELLKCIKRDYPLIEVIMITGDTKSEMAAESLKYGAYDYLIKPFIVNEVLTSVHRTVEYMKLKRDERIYHDITSLYKIYHDTDIIRKKGALLGTILDCAVKALNADTGSIMMYSPAKKNLKIMAATNSGLKIGQEVKVGERISGWVAERKKPLLIQGGFQNQPQFSDLKVRQEILSSMVFPIVRNSKLIGVLNLNRLAKEEAFQFTENDFEALQTFVIHAGILLDLYIIENKIDNPI